MSLPNLEQLEAKQNDINVERDNFIDSLLPLERKKFEAAMKATTALLKAGVPFYLFAQLPSMDDRTKQTVYQWNSTVALTEIDPSSGKPTQESMKANSLFHKLLFSCFFFLFNGMWGGKTFEEMLYNIPSYFHYCLVESKAYANGEELESDEIQD